MLSSYGGYYTIRAFGIIETVTTVLYLRNNGRHLNSLFVAGARRFARLKGWNLQVIDEGDHRSIRRIIDFWKPVGCILDDCSDSGDAYLRDSKELPVVAIDGRNDSCSKNRFRVMHDSVATAEMAARELMALGREHYAFVGFRFERFWVGVRKKAFLKALEINGKGCDVFPSEGMRTWQDAALGRWLQKLPKPCSLFAINDEIGAMILSTCTHLGISVPDDIAVLSVDDEEEICANTVPTLSSIHTDAEQAGYLAAEMLNSRLQNPDLKPYCRFYGPVMAVSRESTAVSGNARVDSRVRKGLDYIRDHIGEPLSARDVVRAMGCSERLAELRFREVLGRSVRDEIQNVRINRVFFYLRCTQQSLGSIANFVGLGDPASLRRFFRQKTGQSLGAWRKKSATGETARA